MGEIQLSHGGGGEEMNALIHDLFYALLGNETLNAAEDAALLHLEGPVAMTTDSFTVSPLFFSGGDIGKLAVAGTVNDLAVMGARPMYLSAGFIIEEGLAFDDLRRIVTSMKSALDKSGARIVCGDTKVVPKGTADGIYINTTGVGAVQRAGLSAHNLRPGDAVIVSGDIGRHGAAILMQREGIALQGDLKSDCAVLWPAIAALLGQSVAIRAMRDATRGGLAAVLNEWAVASNVEISIQEEQIPVCSDVLGVCELLGFEPYDFANEGTFVLAVDAKDAETVLETLQRFDIGEQAAIIGRVGEEKPGRVILQSAWGSRRYLELPKGELLPRIC